MTSPEVAHAKVREVLDDLRRVGIEVPDVPISLVPMFAGPEEGRCLKLTSPLDTSWFRTALIEIKAGLGPTRFGHVAAHEHTHALLHLHGGPSLEPALEEGVCELVAVVWLTNRDTRPEILRDAWANPHPAYGGELRRLVKIARRDGVGTVLERVLRDGSPE